MLQCQKHLQKGTQMHSFNIRVEFANPLSLPKDAPKSFKYPYWRRGDNEKYDTIEIGCQHITVSGSRSTRAKPDGPYSNTLICRELENAMTYVSLLGDSKSQPTEVFVKENDTSADNMTPPKRTLDSWGRHKPATELGTHHLLPLFERVRTTRTEDADERQRTEDVRTALKYLSLGLRQDILPEESFRYLFSGFNRMYQAVTDIKDDAQALRTFFNSGRELTRTMKAYRELGGINFIQSLRWYTCIERARSPKRFAQLGDKQCIEAIFGALKAAVKQWDKSRRKEIIDAFKNRRETAPEYDEMLQLEFLVRCYIYQLRCQTFHADREPVAFSLRESSEFYAESCILLQCLIVDALDELSAE